jgi:hypothetical protein
MAYKKKKPRMIFILRSPDGIEYECENIAKWCRENEKLLPTVARRSLEVWEIAANSLNKRFVWRGWRFIGERKIAHKS